MNAFLDNFDNTDYPLPFADESRILILLTVKQAMRDLINLLSCEDNVSKEYWATAFAFLFDDEHYVLWADIECRLEDLLDTMDIDINWLRRKMREQLEIALEKRKQRGKSKDESAYPPAEEY